MKKMNLIGNPSKGRSYAPKDFSEFGKRKGTIKSILCDSVIEGQQYLIVESDGSMDIVISNSNGSIHHLSTFNYQWLTTKVPSHRIMNSKSFQIKTLVVESDEINELNIQPLSYEHNEKNQLPLKYSQWKSAIEKGEVDTNKEVKFEAIDKYGNYEHITNQLPAFAKIIPRKGSDISTKEFRDADNRFRIGDVMTDEEINFLLERYTRLSDDLLIMGIRFETAWKDIESNRQRLADIKKRRKEK